MSNADLSNANFRDSNLSYIYFQQVNLNYSNLYNVDLRFSDLRFANLYNADLRFANFYSADLMFSNLRQCKAIATYFKKSTLTGICIQDWHINDQTNFENVICDYIYLKDDWETEEFLERRPSNESKIFNQGDFQRLIETTKETIDLIFSQGIDWNAFLTSFNNLQIEDGYHNLSVKAIEQKDDGTFVVRVNAPVNIDKGEIEKRFFNKYQRALKEVTKQYKQHLQAKDEQIEIYRQQSANILELAKLQASQPINVSNVTNNYVDSSLNETVKAIESLINQLSQNAPTNSMSDNMKIATQAIERIETTPTWKEKAIQASQQGLLEAMKTTPVGAFVAGAIESWKQTSN